MAVDEFLSASAVSRAMVLRMLLLLVPLAVVGYNLDVKYPVVHSNPARDGGENESDGDYFGYSVVLVPKFHNLEAQ